jgi:ABC-type molybdate transport system substrate-binding protein
VRSTFWPKLVFAAALSWIPTMSNAAEPVLLHAAGSLRVALNEIAAAYEKATGIRVTAKYGASGTLRDEIASGTRAEVFASANMEHPFALAQAGKAAPVALFARNQLCALARQNLAVEPASLLDTMLEARVKLGTSTPKADPSGDYAWEVFAKADKIKPGAFATLTRKALQLTGGPSSTPPPDRNIYGVLVGQGRADLFLTYCTNALTAVKENPGQRLVALPDQLAVGADYGLTVMNGASPAATRFAMFILSVDAQRILANHGFTAPGLPH